MTRIIITGVLSAFFFSSTFVLNRAMSLEGGHWVWTASLRYAYMLLLLSAWLILTGRAALLKQVVAAYRRNWFFWTVAGSTGFGLFYSLLTFSASFAPGWVVATTWQSTILATPLVLLFFGKRVPFKGFAFTLLIFAGIVMVTAEQAAAAPLAKIALGVLPVVAAAFAYPIGNQMAWEARRGHGWIPAVSDRFMEDSVARVLIMVLGSVPFWVVLTLVVRPPAPTGGQLVNTAMVAVFSGVIATTLFYHARHRACSPLELAAVDATQSTEVLFSLLGEILFLHGSVPGVAGLLGIALAMGGLVLYIRSQGTSS